MEGRHAAGKEEPYPRELMLERLRFRHRGEMPHDTGQRRPDDMAVNRVADLGQQLRIGIDGSVDDLDDLHGNQRAQFFVCGIHPEPGTSLCVERIQQP